MDKKTVKSFSIIKRKESLGHALRGMWLFLRTQHNAWLHVASTVFIVGLGIAYKISHIEWMVLAIVIGIVFISEAFNTAIEIDIDLTSPEYHPYAKDTKDVAAGAVLLSAILAFSVGLIIFLPKILAHVR